MLESLQLGTSEAFLRTLAESHGLGEARIDTVVQALLDVCEPQSTRATPRRRVCVRTGPHTESLAQLVAKEFLRRNHDTAILGADHRGPLTAADLVIDVADYVVPPRRYLPLMSGDVPHLVLVRDTAGVLLGPLVVPGKSPCLRCDDLAKLTLHPEWAVVATQLVTSTPAQLRPEIEWLGALQAGLIGEAFLSQEDPDAVAPLSSTRQLIAADTGEITLRSRSFHDGCGCQAPQDTAMVPPPLADTRAQDAVALA